MGNNFMTIKKLYSQLKLLIKSGDIIDHDLRDKLWVQFIYGSSVVEGVKLKQSEVEEIVKLGSRAKVIQENASDDDLLQALGQKHALQAVEKWAKLKKPITITALKELHYIIFAKIDRRAGGFRDTYIKLRSSALMPTFPFAIAADMRDFDNWLVDEQRKVQKGDWEGILNLITRSYHSITRIHPFPDGNGRTARLFINLLLRKYGLPYIFVPKVDNVKEMRKVLRAADMDNIKPLVEFMTKLLEQALKEAKDYWRKKLGKSG